MARRFQFRIPTYLYLTVNAGSDEQAIEKAQAALELLDALDYAFKSDIFANNGIDDVDEPVFGLKRSVSCQDIDYQFTFPYLTEDSDA